MASLGTQLELSMAELYLVTRCWVSAERRAGAGLLAAAQALLPAPSDAWPEGCQQVTSKIKVFKGRGHGAVCALRPRGSARQGLGSGWCTGLQVPTYCSTENWGPLGLDRAKSATKAHCHV